MHAQMLQTHLKIFGRGGGIVGEKKKRRADGDQRLDKFRRAGNQFVFPVNDTVHVNQVACFHWVK
jgi:hypothetical protein